MNEEIMSELVQLAETIKKAYAENDADLYASAFDRDAIVSMPGTRPVRGRDALKAAFAKRPQLPPGATFKVEALEMEVLSSESAYVYGTDTLEFSVPGSGDRVAQTMTFLVLIKKTSDGWKTFREVVSEDQP